jgi:hypothetical protein
MKIYIICPVRNIIKEQEKEIVNYIEQLKITSDVHSYLNVNQDDNTGYNIVMSHKKALQECDEVHIFWDVTSKGSHMDLGMAVALEKPLKLVKYYHKDNKGKSYLKVIEELNKKGY